MTDPDGEIQEQGTHFSHLLFEHVLVGIAMLKATDHLTVTLRGWNTEKLALDINTCSINDVLFGWGKPCMTAADFTTAFLSKLFFLSDLAYWISGCQEISFPSHFCMLCCWNNLKGRQSSHRGFYDWIKSSKEKSLHLLRNVSVGGLIAHLILKLFN